MAATNFTPIQLYHSSTAAVVPTAGNLVSGELAINITDGKLFYKDSANVVQVIATKSGSLGNVVGPASATDSALVAFDGATGKLIKQSATVSVALGGTGVTTSTGTTNVVLSNSPTLVTPALGTPSSAVLTNATGLPISTGVSGLGTGVATFLATPSSANLAAAVTDETGTGALVFATSPTLVTPALGTPASGVLTNATGLPLTTGVTGTLPTANGGTGLGGATPFTANGVVYASSASALATGSALTFDGTLFSSTVADNTISVKFKAATSNIRFIPQDSGAAKIAALNAAESAFYPLITQGSNLQYVIDTTEQMRLTSTGLEIKQSQLIGYSSYAGIGTNGLAVAGNVGIGTSLPGQKLEVANTSGSVAATLRSSNSGYSELYFARVDNSSASAISYEHSTSLLRFYNGGSVRATLDSSGNLGLGVTPNAGWSNAKAFDVGGFGSVSCDTATTGEIAVAYNAYAQGVNAWKYKQTGPLVASRYAQDSAGGHKFFTAPSGTAGNAISFIQAMTLSASGGLSIGTTSDAGAKNILLDAGGKLAGNAPSGGTSSSIELYNATTGNMNLTTGFSSAAITFATQSTERARISSDGTFRVTGAGSAGTTDAFQVAGGAPADAARIDSSGNLLVGTASNGGTNAKFEVDYAGSFGAALVNTNNTSSTEFLKFYNSAFGVCGVISRVGTTNAVVYNTTSDHRLKTVIGPVANAGQRIDALQPVEYTWNASGERTRGFLAHQFQEVYAGSVSGAKDAVDAQGKPVYQSMQASTSEVIADLVAELQSLRARVASLESSTLQ